VGRDRHAAHGIRPAKNVTKPWQWLRSLCIGARRFSVVRTGTPSKSNVGSKGLVGIVMDSGRPKRGEVQAVPGGHRGGLWRRRRG